MLSLACCLLEENSVRLARSRRRHLGWVTPGSRTGLSSFPLHARRLGGARAGLVIDAKERSTEEVRELGGTRWPSMTLAHLGEVCQPFRRRRFKPDVTRSPFFGQGARAISRYGALVHHVGWRRARTNRRQSPAAACQGGEAETRRSCTQIGHEPRS